MMVALPGDMFTWVNKSACAKFVYVCIEKVDNDDRSSSYTFYVVGRNDGRTVEPFVARYHESSVSLLVPCHRVKRQLCGHTYPRKGTRT